MQTERAVFVNLGAYLRALRPHQWSKNILVFAPLVAGHATGRDELIATCIAFVSFSLCASSAYLLNDMIDMPNDRLHPTKRFRPLAAGAFPISHASVLMLLLLVGALATAAALPMAFRVIVVGYLGTTLIYSFFIKRLLILDVVTLGLLYTIRVLAGSAATGMLLSPWLFAFAMFFFLYLAFVKRQAELLDSRAHEGTLRGRSYQAQDLPVLTALGAASGYVSILIMALYISSENVTVLYQVPEGLWVLCILLLYWISRTTVITARGEMHEDPVVFALKDKTSLIIGAIGGIVLVICSTVPRPG